MTSCQAKSSSATFDEAFELGMGLVLQGPVCGCCGQAYDDATNHALECQPCRAVAEWQDSPS